MPSGKKEASTSSPTEEANNSLPTTETSHEEETTTSEFPTLSWLSRLASVSSFRQTMDEQRLERLQQCQSLAAVLQACRDKQADRPQLEDFPMGIRSVRYFQWRRTPASSSSSTEEESQQQQTQQTVSPSIPPSSCVREEHALWACRGVALKCGGELVQLRDCFREHSVDELLATDATAYEASTSSSDTKDVSGKTIPCANLQARLGHCVAQNVAALAERKKKWQT